ncbi:hypothetical protein [Lentzea flava]|uniref:DUF3105 domain-containing protein n=1 Tax=Lentzea flava TaxID=103732 RepID=A0ABQ2UYH7_9PSEU|nr:hypothetical protein [Lentzea flava]MCP2201947.1 hypothetical protein [Lentzea flava]GGU56447.1 hypothetical protein GCM10010178_56110 [Lentzea flava]
MGKFEDSLWAELQREHGQALLQNMARWQTRRTKRWIGAAAVVTVLGAGGLAASAYFGGAPPAYAVVDNPDGSVTLTLREVEAFDEATAELRRHGVRAFVVPMRVDCPLSEYQKAQGIPFGKPGPFPAVEWDPHVDMHQLKIHRDRIPADAKLVLSAFERQNHLGVYAGFVRGEMPACVRGGEPPQPIPPESMAPSSR